MDLFNDLRSLSLDAPIGYGFLDPTFHYLTVSPFLAEMHGLAVEQHLGRTMAEVVPELWGAAEPLLKQVVERREAGIWEGTAPAPRSGEPRDWLLCTYPVLSPTQVLLGIGFMVLDLTEHKRREDAVWESCERLQKAVEFNQAVMASIGEGLYTLDAKGLVSYVNPVAEKLLGWTSAELTGRKMHDITHYKHPDGRPYPAEECPGLQVLREGKVLMEQADTFIRRDGSFFDVVYSSSPVVSGGQIVGLVVAFRDVTEHKRADTEREHLMATLQRERLQLQAMQQTLQEKVFDLETFHDVAVGRELKMIEMEKELARLREQIAALTAQSKSDAA